MLKRLRALPLVLGAALLLAACGGDDSTAEQKQAKNATATAASTSAPATAAAATTAATAPATRAATSSAGGAVGTAASGTPGANVLGLRCDNVRSYRFNGTLKLNTSGSGGNNNAAGGLGGLLENLDVKLTGAYQAPDRTQLKIELGGQGGSLLAGQSIETVQIGRTSYMRLGSTPWQQNDGGPGDLLGTFTPQELCESALAELPSAANSTKETVNGVATTRYTYTRAQLEELARQLEGVASIDSLRDLQANIWVSDQEKFPVKVAMSSSGTAGGQTGALNLELNVTDLNSNVTIEAPR